MADARYVFIVEWFDIQSSVLKRFNFTFYPVSKEIEMTDLQKNKTFLKKTQQSQLNTEDLYLGGVVTIFSRQLKIVEYADVFTRNYFEQSTSLQKTFAMIKPDAYLNFGKIISRIQESGIIINNLRMTKMSLKDAQDFYAEHQGKPFFDGLVQQMSSDLIIGMELVNKNVIQQWRDIIGPTNPEIARQQSPQSLRALYGDAGPKNVVHGSDSIASADRELNFFFHHESQLKNTSQFSNCTLAIIKPHIIKAGKAGEVIQKILDAGFEISSMQQFQMDRPTSKEFFEVYKGVVPEYSLIAEHMCQGSCIALEIRQEDPVNMLRNLCGPHDPAIAKTLYPQSLRALYGIDRVCNAIHCSDLPEDGTLEVQYFFNILMVPGWKK